MDGVAEIAGEKVSVLHLIQARDPSLVDRPFFAAYEEGANWFTDLKPAFGQASSCRGWSRGDVCAGMILGHVRKLLDESLLADA